MYVIPHNERDEVMIGAHMPVYLEENAAIQ